MTTSTAPARLALGLAVVASLVLVGCRADDEPASSTTTLIDPADREPDDGPIPTQDMTDLTEDPPVDTSEPVDRGPWQAFPQDLANAAGTPRLLVSGPAGITRIDGTASVALLDAATLSAAVGRDVRPGQVVGDGSGIVVVEVVETDADGFASATGLVRLDPTAGIVAIEVGAGVVELHDLVYVDGRPHLLYATFVDEDPVEEPVEERGHLVLHDLSDGSTEQLAIAAAPELFLDRASAGSDVIALSYYSDLTETVSFVDLSGREIDRPSPTDGLEYNAPPLVIDAVVAPDGTEVATIEGPDVDGVEDPEALVGGWDVVVDDAGGEQLRLTVADQSIVRVTIDFDGRWLVVSGDDASGPVTPLLIDTESPDLATYAVDGVRGDAVLESAAGV